MCFGLSPSTTQRPEQSADITWFSDSPLLPLYCIVASYRILRFAHSFGEFTASLLWARHGVFFSPRRRRPSFFSHSGSELVEYRVSCVAVPLKAEQIRMIGWCAEVILLMVVVVVVVLLHVDIHVLQPVQGGMTQIYNGWIVDFLCFVWHVHLLLWCDVCRIILQYSSEGYNVNEQKYWNHLSYAFNEYLSLLPQY